MSLTHKQEVLLFLKRHACNFKDGKHSVIHTRSGKLLEITDFIGKTIANTRSIKLNF
jgi:hypothetical protein